jgi:isopenicillin-N epimerase
MSFPNYSSYGQYWSLQKNKVYLNHGSFGATPTAVTNVQKQFIDKLEQEPVAFMIDELPSLIKSAKESLGNFLNISPNNFVFVNNTTTGVNLILKNYTGTNEHWITTNHAYGACAHALNFYAKKNNCTISVAQLPFPTTTADEVVQNILDAVQPNTRLALIDFTTSASGLILPIKKIVEALQKRGVLVIVDAAHATGMVEYNITDLQPDFFISNLHKWLCTPKGSAFVYVSPKHQHWVHPLVISHLNDRNTGEPEHWSNQFEWDATHDYSAYCCIPFTIEYMQKLYPGGWPAIMEHNHQLAWGMGNFIANELGVALPVKQNEIGSMVNIPMPKGETPSRAFHFNNELKNKLFYDYNIEVPVFFFPKAPTQWLRISAQIYNSTEQYQYLVACLKNII